jgi:cell division protein FtsB
MGRKTIAEYKKEIEDLKDEVKDLEKKNNDLITSLRSSQKRSTKLITIDDIVVKR